MAKSKLMEILSFAILLAILMAFVGLIAGVLYSFGGLIIDVLVSAKLISSSETPGLSYGTALAFLALIMMPAIGAIFGFITGLIGASLYNLVKWAVNR